MSAPGVQLTNVRFHWRGQTSPVISIPELHIERGQHVFLHGPSGSGKSTLLGLLAGVHLPQSGQISIHGEDITRLSQRQRDRFRADHIGYIFQQFNLLPYLDVLHNVTLAIEFSSQRRQNIKQRQLSMTDEAARLLEHLGIPQALHSRKASQLSVGQQQRVAAARALIGAPSLIIADEPTSALDADSRNDFLNLLFNECRDAQTTLIFVSHDQQLASQFSQHLALQEINQHEPA